MLVLFETPAGHALFKVLDKGKLKDVDNIYKEFETPEQAGKLIKLKAFQKFEDTTSALSAATSICDGKLDKNLRKFLAKECEGDKVKLGVGDIKLGQQFPSILLSKQQHPKTIKRSGTILPLIPFLVCFLNCNRTLTRWHKMYQ